MPREHKKRKTTWQDIRDNIEARNFHVTAKERELAVVDRCIEIGLSCEDISNHGITIIASTAYKMMQLYQDNIRLTQLVELARMVGRGIVKREKFRWWINMELYKDIKIDEYNTSSNQTDRDRGE